MRSLFLFLGAALLEVGGGFLVWNWLRNGYPVVSGIIGFVLLALYGVVPVLQSPQNPFGRIYAAYGAVFIVFSLLWGWLIDRKVPDLQDCVGAAICILGALVVMWPRGFRTT